MSTQSVFPCLHTGEEIEARNLITLIRECTWAYGENKTSIALVDAQGLSLADYPSGRAFGDAHEVRWQRSDDGRSYSVQVVCESDRRYPGLQPAQYFDQVDPRGYSLLLWGTLLEEVKDRNVWREVRIPRLLEYPVQRRSQVVYLRIYDCMIGRLPVTTRWLRLEGEG